nr:major capsid family protein [uncultured Flavobacterium sp.]
MATFDYTSLGTYLHGSLKAADRQLYRLPEPNYWGTDSSVIPSVPDLPLGLESYTSTVTQTVGEAQVWDGRSNDIPLVNHIISGTSYKIKAFIDGAEWSIHDLAKEQTARRLGISLPSESVINASIVNTRTGLLRSLHKATVAGIPHTGFEGFLNSTKIDTLDETAETPLLMTPTELEEWLRTIVLTFKISANIPYDVITLFVSDILWNKLRNRMSSTDNTTTYQLLTDASRGKVVGFIRPLTELNNSELIKLGIYTTGTVKEKIVIGDFSSTEKIARHYLPIDRTDPFVKTTTGVHFGITAWAATSEVMFKVPEHFSYIEYDADVTP